MMRSKSSMCSRRAAEKPKMWTTSPVPRAQMQGTGLAGALEADAVVVRGDDGPAGVPPVTGGAGGADMTKMMDALYRAAALTDTTFDG